MFGEQPQSLVGQGVQQLEAGGEQGADAENEQEVVATPASPVPGEDEDAAEDDDAQAFDQGVEQQEAVAGNQVQSGDDERQPHELGRAKSRASVPGRLLAIEAECLHGLEWSTTAVW